MKEKKDPDHREADEVDEKKLVYILGKEPTNKKPYVYIPQLKKISEYNATKEEIEEVEKTIEENGYWEENFEWRIFTFMKCRIEPKMINDKKWFITTVKCGQEVIIEAVTIERAIIFKKLYRDFEMDLWHEQGWASWTKKDEL